MEKKRKTILTSAGDVFYFLEYPPPTSPSGENPVYSLNTCVYILLKKRSSGPRGIPETPGEIGGRVHRVICFERLPELLLRF